MTLKYPGILDEVNSPFFKITCYEWTVDRKKEQNSKLIQSTIEELRLPMSKNGLVEPIINNWDITENLAKDSVSDFAKSFVAQKIMDVIPSVTKYLSYQTGQILNDFSALTFSGNNFREFNLSWDFYPTSGTEFETIKEIGNCFKKNSLPLYDGFKVSYPRFWKIELVIPDKVNKSTEESPIIFNNCALVDVTAEYFQGENISVYNDGGYNFSLSLNFRELKRLSRSDFE